MVLNEQARSEHTHRVAVGAYVFDNNGRMLLLLRRNPPQVWAPPGGRLNPDENPFDGIKREVFEEAGIEIEIPGPAFVWFGKIIPKNPLTMSVDFIAFAKSTEIKLSREHESYMWVSKKQIEQGKIITYRDGYGYAPQTILTAFEEYSRLKAND